MALRINMLSQQHIKDGALYISKTKHEWWELIDFFDEVKLIRGQRNDKRYPVILVVDEVNAMTVAIHRRSFQLRDYQLFDHSFVFHSISTSCIGKCAIRTKNLPVLIRC